jgi:hypothetical protein
MEQGGQGVVAGGFAAASRREHQEAQVGEEVGVGAGEAGHAPKRV